MSAVMDMYLSASDSMSFQDMLDIDIKSEIESLVGGHNDFSGLNFSELPPLELDDVSDIKWFSSNSNHSNSSFNLDFNSEDGTRMVNPNAVMPVTTTTTITLAQNIRSPSPMLKESHLTFSPATIKISSIKQQNDVFNVKKDLLKKLDDHNDNNNENKQQIIKNLCKIQPVLTATAATTTAAKSAVNHCITTGTITTTTNTTNIINGNLKTVQKPSVFTFKNTINRSLGQQINNLTTVRTISTSTTTNTTSINHCNNNNNNNITNNNNNKKINNNISNNYINNNNNSNSNNNKMNDDGGERVYPKPAYSYSCLIAMALKNSRSGSLPVSEIYNFMCKHFPYFITAPNGWKNSVRHNLSLNKCFEKIEKPAINGTQRKGCLWAMNPAKISKMDEEVQKWSRKDPTAIRNAMVNPENLEPLERGELKFSCSYDEGDNFADSCSAESEEGSDCEQEIETNVQTDYETTNEIKTEIDDGNSDLDIEVHSSDVEIEDNYYEDMDDDKEMLRMEMALAQKELMEYEKTVNNKRRRTYIVHN